MTTIECFFLRPAAFAQVSLRRYSHANDCPGGYGYHNSVVNLDVVPYPLSDFDGEPGKGIERDDPRWPTTCPCGYQFKPEDQWQHQLIRLYWRSDHMALRTTLSEAPTGSIYYADWYAWRGPDGHCLIVVTPGGPWIIDGPSTGNDGSKGNPWTRTGEVPKVTVNPSIHFPGKYHGFLRDRFLIEV